MVPHYVAVTVTFEMPAYNVTEQEEQVEVCLLKTGDNEIPVTVTVQPSEIGSAEGKITNQKNFTASI